jgi:hypothetical protein
MKPRAMYHSHRRGYQMEGALRQFRRKGWSLSSF